MGSSISGNVTSTFSTIAVSGQSDIVADSAADTLTMVGSGVTLTTNASTDTLTITGASSPTIGATQVAYATGANTIGGDAGMTYFPSVLSSDPLIVVGGELHLSGGAGSTALLITATKTGTNTASPLQVFAGGAADDYGSSVVLHGSNVTSFNGGYIELTAGASTGAGGVQMSGAAISLSADTLKVGSYNGLTTLIQIFDIDGAAYKTFATLTTANTPDLTIAPPSGGTVTLQASTYKSSDGSSGVSVGPLTAITGITVKNGLVTALTGT